MNPCFSAIKVIERSRGRLHPIARKSGTQMGAKPVESNSSRPQSSKLLLYPAQITTATVPNNVAVALGFAKESFQV